MSAMLETLQIPYTHSGVLASSLAMHKEKSKAIFRAAGFRSPKASSWISKIAARSHPMPLPYVVKPVAEGSSVGVHIVTRASNGPAAIVLEQRDALRRHDAWSERFIPGRELTCAVMGDVALGVIDIVSKQSASTITVAKYAPGGSQHILPADIPNDVYRKCQQISLHGASGAGLPRRVARRFPL